MKKIKIKLCGYDPNDPYAYGLFILNILKKHYDVELSETPEYVFYNESSYEYLNYDAVRIWYTGENVHPNFNLCDYAFGFDYMNFGDRYYRLPLYLVNNFYTKKDHELAGDIVFSPQDPMTKEELTRKTGFCSFVYSNYLADPLRAKLFDMLSSYKKVGSGGRYMNNIGGPVVNKLEFEKQHKFSIAFENSSREGYTTEKIIGALAARSIPIYWGNPAIHLEFNEKRFVNGHRYESFDQIVKRVKQIDADDDLYLSIVNEPIFAENFKPRDVLHGFESFLRKIIDQPLSSARRRHINAARARVIEANELATARSEGKRLRRKKVLMALYKPFKGLRFIDAFKQRIFQKKLHS